MQRLSQGVNEMMHSTEGAVDLLKSGGTQSNQFLETRVQLMDHDFGKTPTPDDNMINTYRASPGLPGRQTFGQGTIVISPGAETLENVLHSTANNEYQQF